MRFHSLGKVGESPEAQSTSLRMIEFLTVPRADGDCVVLLLVHPGSNLLARYFPPSKVNDFLLADFDMTRPPNREADMTITEELATVGAVGDDLQSNGEQKGDLYDGVVLPLSELDLNDFEKERHDVMDLASFLECVIWNRALINTLTPRRFAIQATHCLEMVHRRVPSFLERASPTDKIS